MRLERSQTGIRSVPKGLAVQAPAAESAEEHRYVFESVRRRHDVVVDDDVGWLLRVGQQQRNGSRVDTEDRVQRAASLLRVFVAVGL
jgi:hypothetical protein